MVLRTLALAEAIEKTLVEISIRIRSIMFREKLYLISPPKARVCGMYESVTLVEVHYFA